MTGFKNHEGNMREHGGNMAEMLEHDGNMVGTWWESCKGHRKEHESSVVGTWRGHGRSSRAHRDPALEVARSQQIFKRSCFNYFGVDSRLNCVARSMCEYGIDNGAVEFWIWPLLRLYKLCSLGPRGSQKKGASSNHGRNIEGRGKGNPRRGGGYMPRHFF